MNKYLTKISYQKPDAEAYKNFSKEHAALRKKHFQKHVSAFKEEFPNISAVKKNEAEFWNFTSDKLNKDPEYQAELQSLKNKYGGQKYLTKAAFFGFSKKEKLTETIRQYTIDSHNLYGEHFNKSIGEINERHPNVSDPGLRKIYLEDIRKTMNSNLDLKKEHASLHKKYSADLKNAGGHPSSHELDYHNFLVYQHSILH